MEPHSILIARREIPDAGWLEGLVVAMEPTLEFSGTFDPSMSCERVTGTLGSDAWAFAWRIEAAPGDDEHDTVITVESGDDRADRIVAAVVAGCVAKAGWGTIVTPDGSRIEAFGAQEWASLFARDVRRGRTRKPAKKTSRPSSADVVLDGWLRELAGTHVEQMTQGLPDDPLFGVSFGSGHRLVACRWTVRSGEARVSTHTLGRSLTPDAIEQLGQARQRLVALLDSGPVTRAEFEAETLDLVVTFPGGVLTVHPAAASYGPEEAHWQGMDGWQLRLNDLRVMSEVDGGRLAIR